MKKKLFAALAALYVPLHAAPDQALVDLESLQFEGLKTVKERELYETLQAALGVRTFPQDDVYLRRRLLVTLYETGYFETIQLIRREDALVVMVVEAPRLVDTPKWEVASEKSGKSGSLLSFLGTSSPNEQAMTESVAAQLGLTPGKPIVKAYLLRLENAINQVLHGLGYHGAEVQVKAELLSDDRIKLGIQGRLGQILKLKAVRLIGNHQFDVSEIAPSFCDSGDLTIINRYLKSATESAEISALQNKAYANLSYFYRSKGYLDFSINKVKLSLDKARTGLYILYQIHEGEAYTVSRVQLTCSDKALQESLMDSVRSESLTGNVVSSIAIGKIEARLREKLNLAGYPHARVSTQIMKSEAGDSTASLRFDCQLSQLINVSEINFKNGGGVNESFLRSCLLLQEGSPYDADRAEKDLNALSNLPAYAGNVQPQWKALSSQNTSPKTLLYVCPEKEDLFELSDLSLNIAMPSLGDNQTLMEATLQAVNVTGGVKCNSFLYRALALQGNFAYSAAEGWRLSGEAVFPHALAVGWTPTVHASGYSTKGQAMSQKAQRNSELLGKWSLGTSLDFPSMWGIRVDAGIKLTSEIKRLLAGALNHLSGGGPISIPPKHDVESFMTGAKQEYSAISLELTARKSYHRSIPYTFERFLNNPLPVSPFLSVSGNLHPIFPWKDKGVEFLNPIIKWFGEISGGVSFPNFISASQFNLKRCTLKIRASGGMLHRLPAGKTGEFQSAYAYYFLPRALPNQAVGPSMIYLTRDKDDPSKILATYSKLSALGTRFVEMGAVVKVPFSVSRSIQLSAGITKISFIGFLLCGTMWDHSWNSERLKDATNKLYELSDPKKQWEQDPSKWKHQLKIRWGGAARLEGVPYIGAIEIGLSFRVNPAKWIDSADLEKRPERGENRSGALFFSCGREASSLFRWA